MTGLRAWCALATPAVLLVAGRVLVICFFRRYVENDPRQRPVWTGAVVLSDLMFTD